MRGIQAKSFIAVLVLAALATQASAQGAAPAPAKPEMTEVSCPGFIAGRSPVFQPAALRLAALERGQLPDIVTMNHAHSSHYTLHPEPGIRFVLHGWADDEKPARIDMTYKDVRVRNVPTNIRTFDGGTERHGNSIFIFEAANLCIAHLGHLHHTLTQQQLNEIGKIDLVMVPVDGNYTLDLDGMIDVLKSLKAPLMVPMHYFSRYTLERFLDRARQEWDVEFSEVPTMVVSKASLPAKPKVLVLPGH
jgi:L-ascorbate metabolism protein UlaG (beta-lactamase superfamily)